jgi:hypothetical protein
MTLLPVSKLGQSSFVPRLTAHWTASSTDSSWTESPHPPTKAITLSASCATPPPGACATNGSTPETLAQARRQYDDPEQRGVANNLWASDRSWFIYTDYDLYGTKVS